MTWFFPNGELKRDEWDVWVERPEWTHTGLRVATLASGKTLKLGATNLERVVVPLEGSFEVDYKTAQSSDRQRLIGRKSVFSGPTDTLFLPLLTEATITGTGRVAVAEAVAQNPKPAAYKPAAQVSVELRGTGSSTRQVNNFGTPGALDADRIIVCEVITPSGNWSSYPPHKHDEYVPGQQSNLEEIYYFEAAPAASLFNTGAGQASDPIGYFRNYAQHPTPVDTLAEVRTGDVALVPHGWHGPAMAVPGYDLYYLNVMAGPDPDRSWNIVDDPNHGWVRASWAEQPVDSRLPFLGKE